MLSQVDYFYKDQIDKTGFDDFWYLYRVALFIVELHFVSMI